MRIYFLFWLNLPVGSNLIRKSNDRKNFSERNQKLLENSCISFPYQLKSEWNKHFSFLTSTIQLSNHKTLSVVLIRINFCLLISLYLGRIVCLNLTLVKIKTYNFPLLSILYHRWAEIGHMSRIIILPSSTLVRKWQHHNKL